MTTRSGTYSSGYAVASGVSALTFTSAAYVGGEGLFSTDQSVNSGAVSGAAGSYLTDPGGGGTGVFLTGRSMSYVAPHLAAVGP